MHIHTSCTLHHPIGYKVTQSAFSCEDDDSRCHYNTIGGRYLVGICRYDTTCTLQLNGASWIHRHSKFHPIPVRSPPTKHEARHFADVTKGAGPALIPPSLPPNRNFLLQPLNHFASTSLDAGSRFSVLAGRILEQSCDCFENILSNEADQIAMLWFIHTLGLHARAEVIIPVARYH